MLQTLLNSENAFLVAGDVLILCGLMGCFLVRLKLSLLGNRLGSKSSWSLLGMASCCVGMLGVVSGLVGLAAEVISYTS